MNSFGRLFRISIFGESHGAALGITVDGCPAGMPLAPSDFTADLQRRKPGAKGTTARVEDDLPELLTGVFNGFTTGAPVTILFRNSDVRSADYEALQATPRPGHADFVLHAKHRGFNDYRGGGHSSGRLTACLVAAGVVAKKFLPGIQINARLIEAGGNGNIDEAIEAAIAAQDSIGGVVQCEVGGIPPGLGEPFFDSLESSLAHAAFAIPAIRGIEFGTGFAAARMHGSQHNDALENSAGETRTNNAGGINGGISNGNKIVYRVAVKPASSTPQPQQTWSPVTDAVTDFSIGGRHDLCIALRVPVVLEAVTAIVLADMGMVSKSCVWL